MTTALSVFYLVGVLAFMYVAWRHYAMADWRDRHWWRNPIFLVVLAILILVWPVTILVLLVGGGRAR